MNRVIFAAIFYVAIGGVYALGFNLGGAHRPHSYIVAPWLFWPLCIVFWQGYEFGAYGQ